MGEIVWTNEAIDSLRKIYEYIAEDSSVAAANVVGGIYDKVQLLREFPRIGQRYTRITDREVREILYGHYRIPYLIESENLIEILGVFHGAMDIDRYLK